MPNLSLQCRGTSVIADTKETGAVGAKGRSSMSDEEEDIVRVAKLFTAHDASNLERLKEHFQPKFSEALKTAVKHAVFNLIDKEKLLSTRFFCIFRFTNKSGDI